MFYLNRETLRFFDTAEYPEVPDLFYPAGFTKVSVPVLQDTLGIRRLGRNDFYRLVQAQGFGDIPADLQAPLQIDLPFVDQSHRFKIQYDDQEQFDRYLTGSVIAVSGQPFIVLSSDCRQRETILTLTGADGKRYTVPYEDPRINCRWVLPRYGCNNLDQTAFLFRVPARLQKQGLTRENLRFKTPGGHFNTFKKPSDILPYLQPRPDRSWREEKHKSVGYLSATLATVKGLSLEYLGRKLGPVQDDVCLLSEDDASQSWILAELNKIEMAYEVEHA